MKTRKRVSQYMPRDALRALVEGNLEARVKNCILSNVTSDI
jgi:hypothetical protein